MEYFKSGTNKFIIFCHSYYTISLLLKMLTIVKSKFEYYHFEIIVELQPLYRFLLLLLSKQNNISITYIPYPQKNILSIFSEIKILIILLYKYRTVTKTNILFASRYYIYRTVFLIRLLRKKNIIYFIDVYDDYKKQEKKTSSLHFIKKIKLFIVRVIYGADINYYNIVDFYYTGLDIKFIEQFKIIVENEFSFIKIDQLSYFKLEVPYKIIYFDQDFSGYGFVDEKAYKKIIISIFEMLKKGGITKSEIGIKYHPSFSIFEPLLKYGNEIKKIVPAEFIEAKRCKIIFSPFSTSLETPNIGTLQVALIDLLPWVNIEAYVKKKRSLGRNVLVPKSINEFISIVKNNI